MAYKSTDNFKLNESESVTRVRLAGTGANWYRGNDARSADGDAARKRKPTKDVGCGHREDVLLAGIGDQRLVARYKGLHPDEIMSSIERYIHRINRNTNKLTTELKEKTRKLRRIQKTKTAAAAVNNADDVNRVAAAINAVNDKLFAVRLATNQHQETINAAKLELDTYNERIAQLQNDSLLVDFNVIKNVETGMSAEMKRGTDACKRRIFAEVKRSEKRSRKETANLERLKRKIGLMERKRKALIKSDSPWTEAEQFFYAKLSEMRPKDLYSDTSNSSPSTSQVIMNPLRNEWYKEICKFGMTYFMDSNMYEKLRNMLKINDRDPAVHDYSLPENIVNYMTVTDVLPTKDELAVMYVLKKSGMRDTGEFLNSVERTRNDLSNLHEMKCTNNALWKSLVGRKNRMEEVKENLKLMTNKDVEFDKRIGHLKSVIDAQRDEYAECEKTKNYYLTLLNNVHFALDKVGTIFKKVNISVDDLPDADTDISAEELPSKGFTNITFLDEIKTTIAEIDKKITWCNLLIPDVVDPELFNEARAIYEYKSQMYTQEYILQRKHEANKMLTKTVVDQPVDVELVLTREDVKKQSKEYVTNTSQKGQENTGPKNKKKGRS